MAKRKKSLVEMRAVLERQFKPSLTKGRIDLKKLRKRHPPLAEVLARFIEGKTSRDDPKAVAKDVARAIEARDRLSVLGKALERLENRLGPAIHASAKRKAKKTPRKGSRKTTKRKVKKI